MNSENEVVEPLDPLLEEKTYTDHEQEVDRHDRYDNNVFAQGDTLLSFSKHLKIWQYKKDG